MTYLLCRNQVADFVQWRRVFDSHAEAQRASGLRLEHLWQSLDDPNEVFMLFKVDDLDKALAFVASPTVPEAQKAAGLTEPPEMHFIRSPEP